MIPNIGSQRIETPFKIATIGESSVGKTSIIKIINGEKFDASESPTVGVDFGQVSRTIGNRTITLEIWDTAGQERFRSLVPVYCRNVNAAFAVFDVTSTVSFEKLDSWIELFMSLGNEKRLAFIVGNKADLENETAVDLDKAREWADKRGYPFFLVSAKTGKGVSEMVDSVIKCLSETFPRHQKPEDLIKVEKQNSSCC